MPIEIICQYCGKIKKIKPSKVKIKNYCSRLCYDKAGRSKKTRSRISNTMIRLKRAKGKNNPRFIDGKIKKSNRLFAWVNEKRINHARYIAEQYLNRKLLKEEIVHHINEDKSDDRPENLYLFPSQSDHCQHHFMKNPPILISNII